MQLCEQYRPKTLDEVVGQEKAIQRIRLLEKRGLGGRVFWISGASGTGKTTLARLLAEQVADVSIFEFDGRKLDTAALDEIERKMYQTGLGTPGRNGKAFIINEAHGLKPAIIRGLLTVLEPVGGLPAHVVVVFTTTNDGQGQLFGERLDADPLLSRCIQIGLSTQGLAKAFARRAREIAVAEGLDGRPEQWYYRLVQERRNNMRAVLQDIESGLACIA